MGDECDKLCGEESNEGDLIRVLSDLVCGLHGGLGRREMHLQELFLIFSFLGGDFSEYRT